MFPMPHPARGKACYELIAAREEGYMAYILFVTDEGYSLFHAHDEHIEPLAMR